MLQNVILNEAEVLKTWSGFITESTGVTDRAKLTWMSKYCAYHDMNEKQSLNESALGYAHLNPNMNVGGMGAAYFQVQILTMVMMVYVVQVITHSHFFLLLFR